MSVQVAADLRAAAEVLRRDGWTQGAFHRRADGTRICHCAQGAINVVTGYHHGLVADPRLAFHVDWWNNYDDADAEDRSSEAEDFLAEFLKARSIPGWNDAPGRTADEVIAALEAAAERAEADQ